MYFILHACAYCVLIQSLVFTLIYLLTESMTALYKLFIFHSCSLVKCHVSVYTCDTQWVIGIYVGEWREFIIIIKP